MPTYVYKNLTTGDTFEIRQPITEPALTEHPETGDPVKRVVQPVGIAFKGSGFYVNDSRGSGSAKAGASEGAAKPTTTASATAD
jgi:putative FmdB family regulatory protein